MLWPDRTRRERERVSVCVCVCVVGVSTPAAVVKKCCEPTTALAQTLHTQSHPPTAAAAAEKKHSKQQYFNGKAVAARGSVVIFMRSLTYTHSLTHLLAHSLAYAAESAPIHEEQQ